MKKIIFILLSVVLLSCVSPISKSTDYKEIAKNHKVIAVLPTNAILEIKSAVDAEKIRNQEKLESQNLQKSIYKWLQKGNEKKFISIEIQNVEETNKLLKENGIETVIGKSYKELAHILNVDAVIVSKVSMAKPLTDAEAFFSTLVTGSFFFNSSVTTADISLFDKNTSKVFWNYNFAYGGTFTSTEKLADALMKIATKNFPYNKELEK